MTICPADAANAGRRRASARICRSSSSSAAARPYRRPCHAAAATVPMSSSRYAYATVRAPHRTRGGWGRHQCRHRHRIRSQQARRKQRVGHHIGERAIAFLVAMILPSQYRTAQRPRYAPQAIARPETVPGIANDMKPPPEARQSSHSTASGMSHPAQPRGSSTSRSDPATSVSIRAKPCHPMVHPSCRTGSPPSKGSRMSHRRTVSCGPVT